MDATASSVAASTGRGRGATAGARGVVVGGAGVAAICTRAVASFDGFAPLWASGSPPLLLELEGVKARSFDYYPLL